MTYDEEMAAVARKLEQIEQIVDALTDWLCSQELTLKDGIAGMVECICRGLVQMGDNKPEMHRTKRFVCNALDDVVERVNAGTVNLETLGQRFRAPKK